MNFNNYYVKSKDNRVDFYDKNIYSCLEKKVIFSSISYI